MKTSSKKIKFYKRIERYSWWSLLYLIVLGIFTGLAIITESDLSIIFLFLFLITCMVGMILFIITRINIRKDIINFGINYGMAQKKLLNNLELPYILLDKKGKIYWFNKAFSELVPSQLLGACSGKSSSGLPCQEAGGVPIPSPPSEGVAISQSAKDGTNGATVVANRFCGFV